MKTGTRDRDFGTIDLLASGSVRARFRADNGKRYSQTFKVDQSGTKPQVDRSRREAEKAARTWLTVQQGQLATSTWKPPAREKAAVLTFGEYAGSWMESRDKLKPTTRQHYRQLLEDHIFPILGSVPMSELTPAAILRWHGKTLVGRPTARAHAYSLVRTICETAVTMDVMEKNPCRIEGAGSAKRAVKIQPASLVELESLASAMPQRLRLIVLLAAWCAMRFGELAELRRGDIALREAVDTTTGLPVYSGVIRIRRGMTRADGKKVVGTPKSESGKRDVAIPPHLVPMVRDHLATFVGSEADALLFPASGDPTAHLVPSSLYRAFYPAREAAGRPDLRFHDLRHTGAVLAAQTGATLAELMARLGHSTPQAAMRYQHAAADRDTAIAAALSLLVTKSEAIG